MPSVPRQLDKKSTAFTKKKVIFQQDHETEHAFVVAKAKFNELVLDYFRRSEKWPGRKRFGFNNKIIAQTYDYFEDLDKSRYLVTKMEKRWAKSMQLIGNYVEK